MSEYTVWASRAAAGDIAAPSVEKQETGWLAEYPPHEWFNWYWNRTDKRLTNLEGHKYLVEYRDYNRKLDCVAGSEYTVPEYRVGSCGLLVFLDGILCHLNTDTTPGTYEEVGIPGSLSTTIKWVSDVDKKYDILVKAVAESDKTIGAITINSEIDFRELLQRLIVEGQISDFSEPLAYNEKLYWPEEVALHIDSDRMLDCPMYVVGNNTLEVYGDGILANKGVDYDEVGTAGTVSTKIRLIKDMGTTKELKLRAPKSTYHRYTMVGTNEGKLEAIVEKIIGSGNLSAADFVSIIDARIRELTGIGNPQGSDPTVEDITGTGSEEQTA